MPARLPFLLIISTPDQPWEQSDVPDQEGQSALYFGGMTYMSCSANYCWTPDYCIALLKWDDVSDPAKADGCRLTQANGDFGTGTTASSLARIVA